MVISVHIPKCAGTSFRSVLQRHYGPRLWANYGTIFTREQADRTRVPGATACIHGHFLADAFDDLFPQAQLITWVRHPVERILSHYHFFLRNPGIADGCCQTLHRDRLSLRQFADLDWMRDQMTRYLAAKSFGAFAFVGVTEQYAQSLAQFRAVFGGPVLPAAPRQNVNPGRTTDNYRIASADYGYILERNLADLRWYQEAVLALTEAPARSWQRAPARAENRPAVMMR